MIKELKLVIGDKEIEGDWDELEIDIPMKENPYLDEPFNARRFLIERTDLAGEDIEKVDGNERWKFKGWEITEGGEHAKVFLDIVPLLSINEIDTRIAEIIKISSDPETAHMKEHNLWRDVLVAISEGYKDAQELAKKCLETEDIEFDRWMS